MDSILNAPNKPDNGVIAEKRCKCGCLTAFVGRSFNVSINEVTHVGNHQTLGECDNCGKTLYYETPRKTDCE